VDLMDLPANKTKIVATIGPASQAPEVMDAMLRAGMDVARLNFSHGDFDSHRRAIEHLRAGGGAEGRRLAILADLPGPKMRIGSVPGDRIELRSGERLTLTTDDITGDRHRVSVSFDRLPQAVRPGSMLFLDEIFDL
jgi:pyruvate kinase